MLREGFEPAISASERPQTYPLDRAATGTGNKYFCKSKSEGHPVTGRVGPRGSG